MASVLKPTSFTVLGGRMLVNLRLPFSRQPPHTSPQIRWIFLVKISPTTPASGGHRTEAAQSLQDFVHNYLCRRSIPTKSFVGEITMLWAVPHFRREKKLPRRSDSFKFAYMQICKPAPPTALGFLRGSLRAHAVNRGVQGNLAKLPKSSTEVREGLRRGLGDGDEEK